MIDNNLIGELCLWLNMLSEWRKLLAIAIFSILAIKLTLSAEDTHQPNDVLSSISSPFSV